MTNFDKHSLLAHLKALKINFMQNMAENVFNMCQRDVCVEKKKVTKNFLGQICTTVSGLTGDMVVQILSFFCFVTSRFCI